MSEWSWLPNSNILEINKLLAKKDDERCPIIQSMSAYEPRKKWMSPKKTPEFKYPCVHSTPKTGIRYMYSKVNDRGHFGVSKVIFGESGIYNPVIDMDGKYGMTQGAMAIQVDNLEEATLISKVIESDTFDKIIQSCIFSSFRIDWNIFKEFKKDFWKEFLEKSPQASKPIQLSYTLPLKDSPLPKKVIDPAPKKVTKRRKLKVVEPSSESKVVVENPNDSVIEKLFNPSTGRYIKNTPANRKKIQRQTLKRGGKRKKGTRKRQ